MKVLVFVLACFVLYLHFGVESLKTEVAYLKKHSFMLREGERVYGFALPEGTLLNKGVDVSADYKALYLEG